MPHSPQEIIGHFQSPSDAEYSLKLIESIRWTNAVQSEHFFIGIGYQNSDIRMTQEYYEIIDGVLVRKYYTTNCDWHFETPRTPHKLEKIQNDTHLLFFSLNDFRAAVAGTSQTPAS